ncbi:hypothetical protein D3C78_1143630 [compost metagenome]
MFHLQARIDLEERNRAVDAEKEFDGAGAGITSGSADRLGGRMDFLTLFGGQEGGRGFFDQFLVPALQRAVAGAEYQHIAVLVGENLRLDMARPVKETFEEALAAAESGCRLAHGGFVEIGDLFHLPSNFQAATTAAMRCLDGDGQAVFFGKGCDFGGGRDRAVAAGDQRCADAGGDAPRLDLVAQCFDNLRVRADPDQAGIKHGLREFSTLGQEAVAGMHGIRAGTFGNRDQLGDIEIGLGRAHAFQRIGFIRQPDEKRILIGIGINGDRLQAIIATCADDAHRDLAAIGNQHFFHRSSPRNSMFLAAISANGPIGRNLILALTGICPARSR